MEAPVKRKVGIPFLRTLALALGAGAAYPQLRGPKEHQGFPKRSAGYTKKGPGRCHKRGDGNKTHAARYFGRYSHLLTDMHGLTHQTKAMRKKMARDLKAKRREFTQDRQQMVRECASRPQRNAAWGMSRHIKPRGLS